MEEWIAWDPVKLNSEYDYVSMTHINGLEIILTPFLESGDKVVKICFKGAMAYRYTDEWYTMKVGCFLREKDTPDFYEKRYLFKVKNSEYLKWFFDMSGGFAIDTDTSYQHFAIFTSTALIDIISDTEPIVEFED